MNGRLTAAVAAALFCLLSGSTRASGQEQRRLAHSLPGMADVTRIADLVYRDLRGTADTVMYGPELRYDVYLPREGAGPHPAVIFVHGGLVAGSAQRISPKDTLPAYAQWGRLVAAAGFAGITFSHRLNTNENVDTAASDVVALMREVRGRAAEWSIDPDRVCVAVFSAGGPLASLFMGPDAAVPGIRCIAFYYAFMDMEHAAVISPFRQAHAGERLSALRAYSPAARLFDGAELPPLLVARAGSDVIPGINASIARFMDAALLTNRNVEFYNHPEGRHGFDLTAVPDARAQHILEATLRFFDRHLRG